MFPQPLSRQKRIEAVLMSLQQALELIESQGPHMSLQWLDNIEEQFRPGFEWVKDNLRHANHHVSNETDRQGSHWREM